MLGEKNERQSSVSCDTTDGGDPITLCFTRIATDIKTHCPGSSTPTFYLTTIGDIMSRLSNSNHCDERFKKLVRDVRDRAHKLNDELDDEKKIRILIVMQMTYVQICVVPIMAWGRGIQS